MPLGGSEFDMLYREFRANKISEMMRDGVFTPEGFHQFERESREPFGILVSEGIEQREKIIRCGYTLPAPRGWVLCGWMLG